MDNNRKMDAKSEELLVKFGLKKTTLRLALVSEMLQSTEPLSQGELISLLQEKLDGVDRVTVYRNLLQLKEVGIIHELKDNRYIFCAHECDNHPHILLSCGLCRRFEEIKDHRKINRLMELLSDIRFFDKQTPIALNGTCSRCA